MHLIRLRLGRDLRRALVSGVLNDWTRCRVNRRDRLRRAGADLRIITSLSRAIRHGRPLVSFLAQN